MSQWVVSRLGSEKIPEVAAFVQSQFGGTGSYGSSEVFTWKCRNNPYHQGILNAAVSDGKIISTLTLTPKRLHCRGKEWLIAEFGDGYTHRDFHKKGIFQALVKQCLKDAESSRFEFTYGCNNAQAYQVFTKKLDFIDVPGSMLQVMKLRLDVKQALDAKLPGPLKILSHPVSFAFKAINRLRLSSASGAVTVTAFSDTHFRQWEEFWNSVKDGYDFILSRDSQSFRWRYFDSPNAYRKLVASDGTRILGILVYRILDDNGYPTLTIADYLVRGHDRKVMMTLLSKAALDGLSEHAQKITLWISSNDPLIRHLVEFGFRTIARQPMTTNQTEWVKANLRPDMKFHFSIGDSDNI